MKQFQVLVSIALLVVTGQASVHEANSSGQLLQLHFVIRHGNRTPNTIYPNDPYRNYTFKEGLGMLTDKGRRQLYRLGKELRTRYKGQFVEHASNGQIHARSTNSRRCLESSLALLAGLFPPEQPWANDELARLWTPIGVSTVDPKRDYLLYPGAVCPRAAKIEATLSDNPRVKQVILENKEFLAKVEKYTGQKIKWFEPFDLALIYDSIQTEMDYFGAQFKRPSWLDEIGNDTLNRILHISTVQVNELIRTEKYTRLRAGAFMSELLMHMRSEQSNGNVYAYNTHDILIMNFMQALGYFTGDRPNYGSGILVELRRNAADPSVPNVHIFYANVTNNEAIDDFKVVITPLALNQSERFSKLCHEVHCSLDNFATSLKDFLVTDIESECAVPKR